MVPQSNVHERAFDRTANPDDRESSANPARANPDGLSSGGESRRSMLGESRRSMGNSLCIRPAECWGWSWAEGIRIRPPKVAPKVAVRNRLPRIATPKVAGEVRTSNLGVSREKADELS